MIHPNRDKSPHQPSIIKRTGFSVEKKAQTKSSQAPLSPLDINQCLKLLFEAMRKPMAAIKVGDISAVVSVVEHCTG